MTLPVKLEQSGRTTRLIDDAVEKAANGRIVYVVSAHKPEMERNLIRRFRERGHDATPVRGASLQIRFHGGGSIEVFAAAAMEDEELIYLRTSGSHPSILLLIDHAVIESRFSAMLEMLHRYDPAPVAPTAVD